MPLAAYLMLGTLGLVFGSSYLFINIGLQTVPPFTLTAFRILCAALAIVLVTYLAGHRLPRPGRAWLRPMAIGFAGNAWPFTMIANGQVHISVSLTAILISAVPIFTLVLAHFFSDDRFTFRKVVGVVIGFGGIVLLFGPSALSGITSHFWGQLMIVAAAFGFAVTTVIARHMRDLNPMASASMALISSGIYMIPLAFIVETPFEVDPSLLSASAIVVSGVVGTALAYLVFFRLSAIAGPNFVAMNNYISPAVGVMWGVLLTGDRLGWFQVVALLLILAGIAIATSRRKVAAAPGSTVRDPSG